MANKIVRIRILQKLNYGKHVLPGTILEVETPRAKPDNSDIQKAVAKKAEVSSCSGGFTEGRHYEIID